MPGLRGFSDNPLETREDIVRATEALLEPLVPYMSSGKCRVKIASATGTHFDETAAQLEGFARPLWAVGAMLMGDHANMNLIQPWLDGFENGANPDHPDYWGPIADLDQRMVEAETISFALLASPKEVLWHRLSPEAQKNLVDWLSRLQDKDMPPANWLWFRVFANLALLQVCGVDTPELRQQMKKDLEHLDTFYIGDGWSSDGLWRSVELDNQEFELFKETGRAHAVPDGRAACYYSGSFAIQFSQLLYTVFAGDLDPERTERYRQQASNFGRGFVHYFDSAGAAIPFGRSLTYRFACGAFFAALSFAKVPDMPTPLATAGAVKGFLLRHLRWWASHSENIFHADGTLNIGWTYPQMYLAEDYNSPQSVYWALKSLIVLALAADDEFWSAPEEPYPDYLLSRDDKDTIPTYSSHTTADAINFVPSPGHILCNHPSGNHHFLLSTAQFIGIPFKAVQAKYSKFAYSSAFGFSVPSGGHGLAQIAPDSTLALSRDGTQTWAVKYKCADPLIHTAFLVSAGECGDNGLQSTQDGKIRQRVPAATVRWWPWADREVVVETTVVPPTDRWPDWHIRIHRLKREPNSQMGGVSKNRMFTCEGGFAINGRRMKDNLTLQNLQTLDATTAVGLAEGILQTEESILILSEQGASGIVTNSLDAQDGTTTVTPLKPEPNTSLMRQRTLIPAVEHVLHDFDGSRDIILVTKVFAIAREANGGRQVGGKSLKDRWYDVPQIRGLGREIDSTGWISIEDSEWVST